MGEKKKNPEATACSAVMPPLNDFPPGFAPVQRAPSGLCTQ